jgi:hypothetical protein
MAFFASIQAFNYMKKKTRRLIFILCAVAFFVATPYIILYSLGYRVDFKHLKLTATGGIYVKADPEPLTVLIDNKEVGKTGLFSNAVFAQNLVPGTHSVAISKPGYFNYQKTLPVTENEVTKLESVTLFKQNITFTTFSTGVNYFSMAKDNTTLLTATIDTAKISFQIIDLGNQKTSNTSLLIPNGKITNIIWSEDSNKALLTISGNYYLLDLSVNPVTIISPLYLKGATQVSFNTQNSQELFYIKGGDLYSNLEATVIIKSVITYQDSGQTITFLAADGFIYEFNITQAIKTRITQQTLTVSKTAKYKIIAASSMVFLQQDDVLLLLDQTTKTFEPFYAPVIDVKVALGGKHIAYYNNNELLVSSLDQDVLEHISLGKFSGLAVADWINSAYMITLSGNTISICEIDARGNINTATWPQTITLTDKSTMALNSPKIFFNPQDKKLYLQNQNTLFVSEGLLP